MTIVALTDFLMWCTILNLGIMFLWLIFFILAPDVTYRLQTRFFPMSRDTYNTLIYAFLGVYKIVFLVFVLIPYLALLIIY